MKTKYNDNSDLFAEWTTKKLKQEYRAYNGLIYELECYGISDLRMLSGITKELDNRKVAISSKVVFN